MTHPSLVKRWALNNFMGRSAEDSASSKHPISTHGPNYRFPVPTKWTHFCRYCLRISWDIQLIFRWRMIPLQLQTSMWMDTKKNIFHRQLLGFPSGIFSWLMDVNGIASGKRSQFAKITIFKFATSTISTIFYHGFQLPNCNSHFQRLPRNGHDEFRSPVESQTLAWESPERNRGFKMYSLENPWFLVHKFQFIPSIPILLIILIYC